MSPARRALRLLECALLFGVVPALLDLRALGGRFLPLLAGVTVVMVVLLFRDPRFSRRQLWNARAVSAELPRILGLWAISALAMVGLTLFLDAQPSMPEQISLFALPRHDRLVWAVIMVFYPILSVYPQEVVFRAWFFHRYEDAIGRGWPTIVAGGALFGWAHIIMENWIAVALCVVGGVLIGWTYHRSRSLLAASIEHALYGDWVFTVGIGWLFYSGSVA